MSSIDFRHRLKDHKIASNPDAWNQMVDMLDSLPEKEKKRRKGFWWIFVLISIFILGIGANILKNQFGGNLQNTANIQKETFNQKQYSNSTSDDSKQVINVVETDRIKDSIYNSKQAINIDDTFDVRSVNIPNSESKLIKSNENEYSIDNSFSSLNKSEIKKDELDFSKGYRFIKNNRKESYSANHSKGNIVDVDEGKDFQKNISVDNNNKKTIGDEITKSSNKDFSINELNKNIKLLKPIQKELEYDKTIVSLSPNYGARLNRFFFVGNLGYAHFNGSPGFHLSTGVTYRVNKLLFLESELGYSYGADKYQSLNGISHQEYQYEANLLAIFNLISVKHVNFAFELGTGYTIYRGRRILTNKIDYRKHSGINIQGGLSITYFINAGNGLGIKWGEISYDDGVSYLAFRYMKRF